VTISRKTPVPGPDTELPHKRAVKFSETVNVSIVGTKINAALIHRRHKTNRPFGEKTPANLAGLHV